MGMYGFSVFIGRKEKADERDLGIARKASLAGFAASYLAFVAGCMGAWFITFAWLHQEQISVHVLANIVIIGGVVFYFVRSLAILMLYGRKVEADHA